MKEPSGGVTVKAPRKLRSKACDKPGHDGLCRAFFVVAKGTIYQLHLSLGGPVWWKPSKFHTVKRSSAEDGAVVADVHHAGFGWLLAAADLVWATPRLTGTHDAGNPER